jgi:integrase
MKKNRTVALMKRKEVYYARWYGDDGRQVWRSLKTGDKNLARRKLVAIEGVVESPRESEVVVKSLGYQEAWEIFLKERRQFLGEITMATYANKWNVFWKYVIQEHHVDTLESLSEAHVEAWRTWLAERLKRNSINTHITIMVVIWNGLIKAKCWDRPNPFAGLTKFNTKLLRQERGRPQFLDEEEIKRLLIAARAHSRDVYLFCTLGVYLGLRHGEIMAARWDWFRWPAAAGQTGWCVVPYTDEQWQSKGRKDRTIPMAPGLIEALRPFRGAGREYVVEPENMVWNRKNVRSLVCSEALPGLLKTAAIEKTIRPKELRHTFASNAVMKGVNPYKLMEWMGHESLDTLKIYAHLQGDDPEIARVYTDVQVPYLEVI